LLIFSVTSFIPVNILKTLSVFWFWSFYGSSPEVCFYSLLYPLMACLLCVIGNFSLWTHIWLILSYENPKEPQLWVCASKENSLPILTRMLTLESS
jgi:hypothetical protein